MNIGSNYVKNKQTKTKNSCCNQETLGQIFKKNLLTKKMKKKQINKKVKKQNKREGN